MYYRLKKEWLDDCFSKALEKTVTMKVLIKQLGIVKSVTYRYKNSENAIPDKTLKKLIEISGIDLTEKDILEKLSDNWRQTIGGKNCVKKKKENGTFESQLKRAHEGSRKAAIKWHKFMRLNRPEEYYNSQHEKFKIVGHDKFITKKGEKVRNKLEKDTADWLFDNNISYAYEQLVKIDNKAFFPDFIINEKIALECTMWRGYDKAPKLKEKIRFLEKKYKVFVLIPKALNNYYGILKSHVVFNLPDIMSP